MTIFSRSFKRGMFVLVMLFALALIPCATPASAATSSRDFTSTMRQLWEDHITWTRLYIVSAAAGLPDTDANAERLLQNQTDLGNAIKPYYGEEAGNQLTALLKDHILGAAELITAAKSGDSAAADAASKKWYANGDDIAAFLSSANPESLPLDAMKAEMKMHLDLTLAEATARLQGKFAEDIQAYDKVHEHILGMSDALSSGIMKQFPDKFDSSAPSEASAFDLAMRQLWEDHITWTRLYIVSVAAGLPDIDLTAQRLVQNQDDLGNAIKPYYGEESGNQLTALLRDHILGAADVLAAAKEGDTAAFDAANAKWYANGNDIAAFLNAANPEGFPLDTMKAEMKMHLDLTLAEAAAHLQGDYAGSISGYDKVHVHILGMADALSSGIIAQFPEKFDGATGAQLPTTGMDHAGAHTEDSIWLALLAGAALSVIGVIILRCIPQRS